MLYLFIFYISLSLGIFCLFGDSVLHVESCIVLQMFHIIPIPIYLRVSNDAHGLTAYCSAYITTFALSCFRVTSMIVIRLTAQHLLSRLINNTAFVRSRPLQSGLLRPTCGPVGSIT
jgi:hypothetical protein